MKVDIFFTSKKVKSQSSGWNLTCSLTMCVTAEKDYNFQVLERYSLKICCVIRNVTNITALSLICIISILSRPNL